MAAVVGEVTDSFVLVNRAKINTRRSTILGDGSRQGGVTSTNHVKNCFFGMNESINQSGITQEDEGGVSRCFLERA